MLRIAKSKHISIVRQRLDINLNSDIDNGHVNWKDMNSDMNNSHYVAMLQSDKKDEMLQEKINVQTHTITLRVEAAAEMKRLQ